MKALFAAASGVSAPLPSATLPSVTLPGGAEAPPDLWPDLRSDLWPDLWPAFLDQLGVALGADQISLHLIRQGRQTQLWQRGGAAPLPDIAQLEKMRTDRVYSQFDLPQAEAQMGQTQQPLRALRCAVGREAFAAVVLQRRGRDFRGADAAQLSHLAPYLGSALMSWESLERERARAALDRRMAQDLGAFWLRLTPSGRVIDMAAALRHRLGPLAPLRLQLNGWLAFSDPAIARRFRQALATALAAPTTSCRIELSHRPPMEMLIRADAPSGEPALVALLRQMPLARALPLDHVAQHFDLNRSEARLTQLLCDGFSLQDAAQDLGWTIETTRSCSKKIFARMGVRGQTGVLHKVLTSALWLQTP